MKYFILIIIGLISLSCSQSAKEKEKIWIGDNVIIRHTQNTVTVADSRESLDRFVKVVMSKDEDRYNALVSSGRIYEIENNTKGKITDYKEAGFEVKILSGKYEGRYVWLTENVLKLDK